MKLFLSPTISNSNEDPAGEYKGPVFCSNDWSNVTRGGGFSNKSNELCVNSVGITMLVRIFFIFEKKSDRLLCGFVFREMIFFVGGDCFLYAFFFDLLPQIACFPRWSAPPICFLAVFATVLFRACFADFFLQILITLVHLALAILFQLFLLLDK